MRAQRSDKLNFFQAREVNRSSMCSFGGLQFSNPRSYSGMELSLSANRRSFLDLLDILPILELYLLRYGERKILMEILLKDNILDWMF